MKAETLTRWREEGRKGALKGRFFRFLQFFEFSVCVSSPVRRARAACPRSSRGAGIQAQSLWIAGLLDSRLRGNDDSALLVVKNLPLKGGGEEGGNQKLKVENRRP